MSSKSQVITFSFVVSVIVLGILLNYLLSETFSISGNSIKRVHIRDVLVKAEVVSSKEKIEQGLAGRKNLPEGRGMLFEWRTSDVRNFWMKGMRFPIDIIWIENSRVIGCEKNISPEDERIFSSPGPAAYVLEVPENFCDRYGVATGDKVTI